MPRKPLLDRKPFWGEPLTDSAVAPPYPGFKEKRVVPVRRHRKIFNVALQATEKVRTPFPDVL